MKPTCGILNVNATSLPECWSLTVKDRYKPKNKQFKTIHSFGLELFRNYLITLLQNPIYRCLISLNYHSLDENNFRLSARI